MKKNHCRRASVAEREKNQLHKAISKLFYVTVILLFFYGLPQKIDFSLTRNISKVDLSGLVN